MSKQINPSDYEGHTKGPWIIGVNESTQISIWSACPDIPSESGVIVHIYWPSRSQLRDSDKQNAKLIADSPAILAALVEAQKDLAESERRLAISRLNYDKAT